MRFRNELARFMCGWRTNRAAAITHSTTSTPLLAANSTSRWITWL
ncbi:hypothetical protein [Variovorax sp. Varisp36]